MKLSDTDYSLLRELQQNEKHHIEQYKQELETLISWNFHIPKTQTTFY
jgi:hypothetical protein